MKANRILSLLFALWSYHLVAAGLQAEDSSISSVSPSSIRIGGIGSEALVRVSLFHARADLPFPQPADQISVKTMDYSQADELDVLFDPPLEPGLYVLVLGDEKTVPECLSRCTKLWFEVPDSEKEEPAYEQSTSREKAREEWGTAAVANGFEKSQSPPEEKAGWYAWMIPNLRSLSFEISDVHTTRRFVREFSNDSQVNKSFDTFHFAVEAELQQSRRSEAEELSFRNRFRFGRERVVKVEMGEVVTPSVETSPDSFQFNADWLLCNLTTLVGPQEMSCKNGEKHRYGPFPGGRYETPFTAPRLELTPEDFPFLGLTTSQSIALPRPKYVENEIGFMFKFRLPEAKNPNRFLKIGFLAGSLMRFNPFDTTEAERIRVLLQTNPNLVVDLRELLKEGRLESGNDARTQRGFLIETDYTWFFGQDELYEFRNRFDLRFYGTEPEDSPFDPRLRSEWNFSFGIPIGMSKKVSSFINGNLKLGQ